MVSSEGGVRCCDGRQRFVADWSFARTLVETLCLPLLVKLLSGFSWAFYNVIPLEHGAGLAEGLANAWLVGANTPDWTLISVSLRHRYVVCARKGF
ncbi:hypothetical protein GPALN_004525 [Globodera pallida]|nr:hypothetical protein GPALN_004525 [Globodera pallida]